MLSYIVTLQKFYDSFRFTDSMIIEGADIRDVCDKVRFATSPVLKPIHQKKLAEDLNELIEGRIFTLVPGDSFSVRFFTKGVAVGQVTLTYSIRNAMFQHAISDPKCDD